LDSIFTHTTICCVEHLEIAKKTPLKYLSTLKGLHVKDQLSAGFILDGIRITKSGIRNNSL